MRQEGARITAQANSRRSFLQSIHNDVTLKWPVWVELPLLLMQQAPLPWPHEVMQ